MRANLFIWGPVIANVIWWNVEIGFVFGEPIAVHYEASKMSNEGDCGHTSNILANKVRVKSQNITQTQMAKICIWMFCLIVNVITEQISPNIWNRHKINQKIFLRLRLFLSDSGLLDHLSISKAQYFDRKLFLWWGNIKMYPIILIRYTLSIDYLWNSSRLRIEWKYFWIPLTFVSICPNLVRCLAREREKSENSDADKCIPGACV